MFFKSSNLYILFRIWIKFWGWVFYMISTFWHVSVRSTNYVDRFVSYCEADLSIYLSIYLSILSIQSIYGSTALVGLGRFFSFLIYTQSVGLLGRGPVRRKAAIYTQNNTNKNKRTQTSMPRVGFVPTIPVFERTKTVHALDRAASCDQQMSSRYHYVRSINSFPCVLLNTQIM
jgi:hypothetical protein